ncbi:hypothetical protein N482_24345 [Pseudoalteromonas luteoviolacea NCIMB 1942]|uniref:Transposase IS4-like domain-containing protein n=1 Tax=Pseudoalteromonas luteoviolacea NCIMB 1942 TaxID=1365253 RepID=A0A161YB05_9GAMM|nr:hypothetical protein N482_24345 [Pseudoalteromonas luteoviolacea NCIMB 1942]
MFRASKRINPTVSSAFLSGVEVVSESIKLQSLLEKFGSQPLEMVVKWNKNGSEYRLAYVPDNKRPILLLTKLPETGFNFDQLLDIYAMRWQIELFFKELKSWNNLKGFMITDPDIAESLVWLSLLLAFVKRFVCHSASRLFRCAISTFKANKSALRWLGDVLNCFDLKHPQKKFKQVLEVLATSCQRQVVVKGCNISRFCVGSESVCVA